MVNQHQTNKADNKMKAHKLGNMTIKELEEYKEEIIKKQENLSELIDDIDEIINSKIGIFKEKTNKGVNKNDKI